MRPPLLETKQGSGTDGNHGVQAHASDIGRAAYDAQHRVPMPLRRCTGTLQAIRVHACWKHLEGPLQHILYSACWLCGLGFGRPANPSASGTKPDFGCGSGC